MITDEQLAAMERRWDRVLARKEGRQAGEAGLVGMISAADVPDLLAEIARLKATERQYTIGRERIAELMGWCARELGRSNVHKAIRHFLAIPDAAYPWESPAEDVGEPSSHRSADTEIVLSAEVVAAAWPGCCCRWSVFTDTKPATVRITGQNPDCKVHPTKEK